MPKDTKVKYHCPECEKTFLKENMLTAPNPFDPDDEVCGCPWCKSCIQPNLVCDEKGCNELFTMGWLDDETGYRLTCYKHTD